MTSFLMLAKAYNPERMQYLTSTSSSMNKTSSTKYVSLTYFFNITMEVDFHVISQIFMQKVVMIT